MFRLINFSLKALIIILISVLLLIILNRLYENILDYEDNNISFDYSVTNYQVFEKNEFQHRLVGYNDNWSEWLEKSSNSYNNLMCFNLKISE